MGSNVTDDIAVAGRLNDGWAYGLTLRNGATVRVCDHDRLVVVLERWQKEPPEGFVQFSGASDSVEEIPEGAPDDAEPRQVVLSPDGQGAFRAAEIVGIRYWGPSCEIVGEAAFEAARALTLVQKQSLEDSIDDLAPPPPPNGNEGQVNETVPPEGSSSDAAARKALGLA